MKHSLALLETSSNQRYIFASNRLRDAVGASFVINEQARRAEVFARRLGGSVTLATGGAVEVVFADSDAGHRWVSELTLEAFLEAPGLDLAGAVLPIAGATPTQGEQTEIRTRLERNRSWRRGPTYDQAGVSWVTPCHYTGLPAIHIENEIHGERQHGRALSAQTAAVRAKAVVESAKAGIATKLRGALQDFGGAADPDDIVNRLSNNIDAAQSADLGDEFEGDRTWRALIHTDGNAIGRLFMQFRTHAAAAGIADSEAARRQVSAEIERAAWRAFAAATVAVANQMKVEAARRRAAESDRLPIYPLQVGGDDLTVVVAGRYALLFAASYLEEFEVATADENASVLAKIRAAAVRNGETAFRRSLHAAAGVAVFKHHFPFALAYEMAADLCRSAKGRCGGEPLSALDWHVIYDASPPRLDVARERLVSHDATGATRWLTRRPYIVSRTERGQPWLSLCDALKFLLSADGNDRDPIPRSLLQDVRAALYEPGHEAERVLSLLLDRGGSSAGAWKEIVLATGGVAGDGAPKIFDADDQTGLIDLIESQYFLEPLAPRESVPAAGARP